MELDESAANMVVRVIRGDGGDDGDNDDLLSSKCCL